MAIALRVGAGLKSDGIMASQQGPTKRNPRIHSKTTIPGSSKA
jgi:hypothetical protein